MKPHLLLPVLLAALASAPAFAQPAPATLADALQRTAARLEAGGLVAAEVQGPDIRYSSAGQPAPRPDIAPEKIIFEIGSITKVFTSLLLAQTVLEGKAALSDPISRHLPADLELDPKVAALTLEQLAAHTSGLPRLPSNLAPANPADPYADYTVARLHDFLRQYHPAESAPRPSDYSNLGAGLLGHLLERIHGQTYARLLADRIAGPLGMADTVITLNDEQQTRFARPHSGSMPVAPWHLDALAGAGAIRSTASDLARFGQALLSPGSPLHPAWEMIRQPRADFGADKIGLGVFVGSAYGRTFYHHGGGTGGFRSIFEITPAAGKVVIVLLNNDAPEPLALVAATRGPAAPAATAPDSRPEVAIDAAALAEFAGIYRIDARGSFTALVDADGRLRLRLTGQPFLTVTNLGQDRFLQKNVGAEFQFARDAAGRIDSVTLHQAGRQIPAQRAPDPVPTVLFLAADQLQAYTGKYELAPGAIFEVTSRAGHLIVKLTGQPAFPVFCDGPDHFVYDVVEAALAFERDATGTVIAVVLHQNGLTPRAPRLPAPAPPPAPAPTPAPAPPAAGN